MEELHKNLRIEEETRSRATKNNYHESSKVNVVEASKFHKNFKVKNYKKFKKKSREGQNKFTGTCFFCGKKGHRRIDYKYKEKKDGSSFNNPNKANMVENQVEKYVLWFLKCKLAWSHN